MRNAGIDVLGKMVDDALGDVPWNTAHWAAANLYSVTRGKHEVIDRVISATEAQLEADEFLKMVAVSLRSKDQSIIVGYIAPPNPILVLDASDPRYEKASQLWRAAAEAEQSGV